MRRQRRAAPVWLALAEWVGWALLYAGAMLVGRATRVEPSQLALFWPAAGVSTVWLLRTSPGARPVALAGLAAVTGLVNAGTGVEQVASWLFGIVNAAHAVVAVTVLSALGWRRPRPPQRLSDVGVLLAASVAAAAASAALGGVVSAARFDTGLWDGAGLIGTRNAISTFLVVAVLLALPALRSGPQPASPLERVVLAAVTLGVTYVVLAQDGLPVAFLLVPVTVLTAMRCGVACATVMVAAQSVLIIVETLNGAGPFALVASGSERVLLAQALMAVLVLVTLCLSLSEQDRERALAASRAAQARLEDHERAALVAGATVTLLEGAAWVTGSNRAMHALTGVDATCLDGSDLTSWFVEDERAGVRASLDALRGGHGEGWRGELRLAEGHGGRWVDAAFSRVQYRAAEDDASTGETVLNVQMLDVSARKQAEERLSFLALHDELTGLPNRALWHDRLSHALADSRRFGTRVGILYVDLDHFKAVNDTYGHETGDHLLVEVGARLQGAVRPRDTVARIGGDEFVVVCPDIAGDGELSGLAARLLGAVQAPLTAGGHALSVTASIGVCLTAPGDLDARDLLRRADTALYSAKQGGRSRIEAFSSDRHAEAAQASALLEELAGGLDRHELVVQYQPIVDMATGRPVALEALVRWEHPVRGVLLPVDFLDLVESSDLVHRLGEVVLARAVEDAAVLAQDGTPLAVHVNVSARQLDRRGLVEHVQRALAASGLPPHLLALEVTETRLLALSGSLLRDLQALCDLGVRIAVDDFGTGYSALTHLIDMPVHTLKLDRSFVAGLGRARSACAVASGVIAIARGLDIGCVAEGVETQQQVQALTGMGYRLAQGWLYAPAMDVEQLRGWLRDQPQLPLPLPRHEVVDLALGATRH